MMHIHKWSNWIKVDVPEQYPYFPHEAQERECKRCGKIERLRL